ncbi:MAG TPA: type I secretion system permease/ATPase [Micropepsaceae bacterium]|nr:type I secretion system permease/ATPase [Micropepsaceae bacterium]
MVAKRKASELSQTVRSCRSYFTTAATFSLAINLLYLSAPLYMLQLYDRVVSSSSEVTLVMLTIALVLALMALSGLDLMRARVLTRASLRLDRLLAGRVMTAIIERARFAGGARSQPLRDFDNFRQYITGLGIHAVFDLPWAPIYIFVIFLLNPLLGFFALGSAVLLVSLALINEWRVRAPLADAGEAATRTYNFTEMSMRNSEVVQAMGMTEGLLRRWVRDRARMLERQATASDRAATITSLIRFFRLSVQSIILGLGAYLVIEHEATVGSMFAASFLLARALQPVEQIVSSWRNLLSARNAYGRVRDLLATAPVRETRLEMPRPSGHIAVEGLTHVTAPGTRPLLRNVGFRIEAGEVLGIIGPSGAGKSTLCRHIVGVLRPSSGTVRIDGVELAHYSPLALGRDLGYLPQDIELFADTVGANIGRFVFSESGAIVAAAQLAGAHEMILRLPDGYETQVGDGGMALSGGYRQRVGLARAVFGNPSVVVLDEPSSNLDSEGDAALAECINRLKNSRVTVIIVSHRPTSLAVVDKILLLRDGMVEAFGPRAEVLARLAAPAPHVVASFAGQR